MFALSEPGKLEDVLATAGLTPYEDEEIECPIVFDDVDSGRARLHGGRADTARDQNSGEATVAEAVRSALEPFTDADGRVVLPAWYRAVLARG